MIFNIMSGKKPTYTVTLYGYTNNTILVDGTTTVSLNSSGVGTVVLELGSHTFKDGYVSSNTKTVNITSDTTVVVGYKLTSMPSQATARTQGNHTAGNSSEATNSNIPAASYTKAKVIGTVSGYQYNSGYHPLAEATVDGRIKFGGSSGVSCGYNSNSVSYSSGGTSRSISAVTISGTGNISFSGGSVVLRAEAGAIQGDAYAYTYLESYVNITECYIY